MRKIQIALLLAALPAGGCDAASPYRAALREQTSALGEVAQIMGTVTDENSMKAARGRLEVRYDAYESIRQRAAQMPRPSQEIIQQVLEDGEKLKGALQKVQEQVRRIQALPGGPEFLQGFEPMRGF